MTLLEIEKDLEINHKLTWNKKIDNETVDFFNKIEEILA
jgi:hypothetical protein